MTPQSKANDLVGRYLIMDTHDEDSFIVRKHRAMQCALIAVHEIINAIDWHEFEVPNKELGFWVEVKKEIEKL